MTGALARAADGRIADESPFRRNIRLFLSNRLSTVSAAVVLAFMVLAVATPLFAPHDPNETDLFRRLQPPVWMAGGEWAYLLGCDALGRDILSRIIYGSRISIFIGVVVILLATCIGTTIPLLLNRFDIDPALATGPFVTTSNDILGILIYLSLAGWVYGRMG